MSWRRVRCPTTGADKRQTNPTVSCLFGKPWGNQGAYQRDATNMTPFPFHWIFNHRQSLRLLGHSWTIGGLFCRVTEHDIMLLTSIDIQSICILSLVHLACNELLIGAPSLLTWWCWMTGRFKVWVSLWISCCCRVFFMETRAILFLWKGRILAILGKTSI